MMALARKDLRISLDLLRPVALIAAAVFVVAPWAVVLLSPRLFGRTWTMQEVFMDLATAALIATPVIGGLAGYLLATGDERHGAGTLVQLLPVSRARLILSRLITAVLVTLLVGVLLPLTAWALSGAAAELMRGATTIVHADWSHRAELLAWALGAGGIALAATWGSVALGPRPAVGLVIGFGAAAIVVGSSAWLASLVLDTRYEIAHDAMVLCVSPLLPAAAIALMLTGTVAMIGMRPRLVAAIGIGLALLLVIGTPIRAHVQFVRPAMAYGWISYAEEEVEARSHWEFAARLRSPEAGYSQRAAWRAFHRKLEGMNMQERIEFRTALLEIIEQPAAAPADPDSRLDCMAAIAAIDPLVTEGGPAVFERLERLLDQEMHSAVRTSITNLLTRRAFLRPSAAEAIERSSARFDDAESRAWSFEQAARIREEIERFRSGMQPGPPVQPRTQPQPGPAPAP